MIIDFYRISKQKIYIMKILFTFAICILISSASFAQDDVDKTDYKGTVVAGSSVIINTQTNAEKAAAGSINIVFDSKTITIKDEAYAIVSKEFDGIDTNTFLCTKRGSNFTINYVAGEFISVEDNSNPNKLIKYTELQE